MDNLFPSGIARGDAFCNRETEKARLKHNVSTITHTLIISPRRYGKTSLVLEVLRATKTPHAYIQFFNAFRDASVIKRFIAGFNSLLTQITPPSRLALKKLGELIKHGKVVLKTQGVEAEFGLEPIAQDPLSIIEGLLKDIEQVAKKYKKKVVIFLDEFQDITHSDLSNELQSMLRDFIQLTDSITFIISGSHRHMLMKLFDDKNKPFYKLFDRILLNRIAQTHYETFLQMRALETWKKPLPLDTIKMIAQLTGRHAYYFNRLCQKVWTSTHLPNSADIYQQWQALAEEEFSTIALELASLTKNQRIILEMMAKHDFLQKPTGIAFLNEVGLPHRSVLLAIDTLEKNDLVERTQSGYQVLDPLMKYVLSAEGGSTSRFCQPTRQLTSRLQASYTILYSVK